METEFVGEVFEINPIMAAEAPAPVPTPTTPVDIGITGTTNTEDKTDRRFGTRKTVNADGSVSYGLTTDGKPRKRPGRKPKSS